LTAVKSSVDFEVQSSCATERHITVIEITGTAVIGSAVAATLPFFIFCYFLNLLYFIFSYIFFIPSYFTYHFFLFLQCACMLAKLDKYINKTYCLVI